MRGDTMKMSNTFYALGRHYNFKPKAMSNIDHDTCEIFLNFFIKFNILFLLKK